jgi:hypothetical protein
LVGGSGKRERAIYVQFTIGHFENVVPHFLLAVGLVAEAGLQPEDKLHDLLSPARALGSVLNVAELLHELKRALAVLALEEFVFMKRRKSHRKAEGRPNLPDKYTPICTRRPICAK